MPNLSRTSTPAPTTPAPTPVAVQPDSPRTDDNSRWGEQRVGWRPHDDSGHRNEVVLAGRVTAEPAVRELPSGTHLVTWRISVTRPAGAQRPNQPADPITCVSFHPSIEEATRAWRIGDLVQVGGALRRRFWRSPNGSSSVIEVEARTARRLAASGTANGTASGADSSERSPDHQPR